MTPPIRPRSIEITEETDERLVGVYIRGDLLHGVPDSYQSKDVPKEMQKETYWYWLRKSERSENAFLPIGVMVQLGLARKE